VTTLASLEVITAFWAAYLGCRRAQLSQPATVVVRNGPGLADYHGATAFFRPPACVLAVPADWYEHTTARLAHQPAAAAFEIALLRAVFGAAVDRVVGPAWLGYADHGDFRPAGPMGTRRLTDQDLPALRELAAACGPTAWAHSGIDPARRPVYGCYADRTLVAAGMLEPWGDRLLHVGIVTHPAHRGRGYGTAVVSAMTADGLADGRVVQYRTLQATLRRWRLPASSASSPSPTPSPSGSPVREPTPPAGRSAARRTCAPAWPCPTAHDLDHLARVPAPAGRRDPRVRPAAPSTPSGGGGPCGWSSNWTHPAGPPGRRDRQPQRSVGHPAGPQPAAGPAGARTPGPLPAARP
jgi:GNAT superfamily N-acetyltransferase